MRWDEMKKTNELNYPRRKQKQKNQTNLEPNEPRTKRTKPNQTPTKKKNIIIKKENRKDR